MRPFERYVIAAMRLRMFGNFQIEGEAPAEAKKLLSEQKVCAFLSYMLLARPRGLHQRDRLVGLFWPESDQERARTALRGLLYRLRMAIPEAIIDARGNEFVGVAPGSIWCDALAFDAAVSEDRLREALELYLGDLLPSSFQSQSGEFERWLAAERDYYKERAVNAAWELVQRYVADSELTNASQLARLVARLSPTDERRVRRVMSMLANLGDRAGAIDVFTRFASGLWRELEIRPSRETMQLAEAIRSGAPLPS